MDTLRLCLSNAGEKQRAAATVATGSAGSLAERLDRVLALDPSATAVEFRDLKYSWGKLAATAAAVEAALQRAQIPLDAPIGWVARNRPSAVASCIALIMRRRMIAPLRPSYSSSSLREDLLQQRLQAVVGDAEDWSDPSAVDAAREAGTVGIRLTGPDMLVDLVPGLEAVTGGPHRTVEPGVVLERLTSGTTGAPKRITVQEEILIPSLKSGEASGSSRDALTLKRSPALLFKPFSHAGGLFGLLLALYQARPMVLFERFVVADWVRAVKVHRPKSASLVPAMIRMILDSDTAKEDLSSLLAVRAGTAPLEPEVQAEFEHRFGVPILVDYGAAEFLGGVAGWTLDDHRRFSETKSGSVGRPRRDVKLRAVSSDDFSPLPAEQVGLIEIYSPRYGPDWIRTNDLGRLDPDGFLYLHGRADDAINRGGFKILPEQVAAILRRHPAVEDAAVVGAPDPRLGQVPIAALELRQGAAEPTMEALSAIVREHLPPYMAPVEYRFVDRLPRTASLKISRPELKKLLGIAS